MRLSYIGPHDEVSVPLPTGGTVECKRGEECQVPDSHAALLLEQPTNWQQVGGRATKDDLRARLEGLGIDVPADAKKADLEQLLADRAAAEQVAAEQAAAEAEAAAAAGDGSTDTDGQPAGDTEGDQ